MSIDSEYRPLANNTIMRQEIGQEVMLHDNESDTIHVLNQTAFAVWELCDGTNTTTDMHEKLSIQFPDAGSELLDDIEQTLESFRQKKLLVE